MTYASAVDVRTVLGKLGSRLPAEVDVDAFLAMAEAVTGDRLAELYGPAGPDLTGQPIATEVVRWATAKRAAADVLDVLRASVDVSDLPERLRKAATEALAGGLPGLPLGTDNASTTPGASSIGPRISDYARGSYFDDLDPYADTRPLYPS
jgi:hypothetical protein